MEPSWYLVVPVLAEAGWFAAVGPRLFRNYRAAARRAADGEPVGPVPAAREYLVGLAWMAYHWPVVPLMMLTVAVRPPVWVRFGALLTLMAVTPVAYSALLGRIVG